MNKDKKIVIGVSSCLLGDRVRYDGNHKYNRLTDHYLRRFFILQKYCPEMAAGMGSPRSPVELKLVGGEVHCVDVEDSERDLTRLLLNSFRQQSGWLSMISGFVFKTKSPNCGLKDVPVHIDSETGRFGAGLFVQFLQRDFPKIPVIDEDMLSDPVLRRKFIQEVVAYDDRKR